MNNFINQLDIKAFRKIQDLSLTGLGRVNLFVGENDSGKSSILEAIQLFCNPMDPIEIMSLAHYRESERELDSATALRWLFPKEKYIIDPDHLELAIEVSGTLTEILRIVRNDFTLSQSVIVSSHLSHDLSEEERATILKRDWRRTVVNLKYGFTDQIQDQIIGFAAGGVTIVEGQDHFVVSDNVHKGKIPCVAISPVSHRIGSFQRSHLSKATLEFLKSDVVTVLQLIDEDVRGLDILEPFGRHLSRHGCSWLCATFFLRRWHSPGT